MRGPLLYNGVAARIDESVQEERGNAFFFYITVIKSDHTLSSIIVMPLFYTGVQERV